jgi:hypothetical protein
MNVPITSDLGGYQAFWRPLVLALIAEQALIALLLVAILVALMVRR